MINVNGANKVIYGNSPISYDDVCKLAYGRVIPGLTCTYSFKEPNSGGGHLISGQSVVPVHGMRFNIFNTSGA